MTGRITPGELETGQYITISRGEEIKIATYLASLPGLSQQQPPSMDDLALDSNNKPELIYDSLYNGDVFEVKAVSLPFVAVINYSIDPPKIMKFDTRNVELSELDAEYVEVMKGAPRLEKKPISYGGLFSQLGSLGDDVDSSGQRY